jgi:NtrC-family two-component system sensor histidine kinase KinB
MKLKNKITSGFFVAIIVLIASGVISIIEFRDLSNQVQSMLNDNYKSIKSSNEMLEALDIIDENIMMEIISEDFITDHKYGDSLFLSNLEIVKNNLTEENEDVVLKNIEAGYNELKEKSKSIASYEIDTSTIVYYHNNLKPSVTELKANIIKLLEINQHNMYSTAAGIENQARNALMPGIIAIVAAIIFALLFSFFINKFIVKPISTLTENIHDFNKFRRVFTHDIKTKDEIEELYNAVELLVINIKSDER